MRPLPETSEAEFQQAFPRLARLAPLVEMGLVLNSTLDVQRLLKFIVDAAAELVESEAVSILLFDDNTRELKFAAATGSDPAELAKIPVPIDRSIAGSIFTGNKPLIINNAQEDPRLFRTVGEKTQLETRQLLGVPMRIKERATGVLEAVNKRQGVFDDTDAYTLSIIASQAAVAIENARLVHALQKAYDELGKLEKIKSDFIAIASHELRTPLGVALGYATFIREQATGETAAHAESVLNAVNHMRVIIEEMTSVNYLQAGKVDLQLVRLDLRMLLQDAVKRFAERAQSKNQTLRWQPPSEALVVKVDPNRVSLIVSNLLNNALRFTPEGGQVEVAAERRGMEAWAWVADNGIGVRPDLLEKIFDEFYQVEDHMTRRHGGVGLGLSIVRGLAQVHGGRAWAESAGPGHGSKMVFTLPMAT